MLESFEFVSVGVRERIAKLRSKSLQLKSKAGDFNPNLVACLIESKWVLFSVPNSCARSETMTEKQHKARFF